MLNRPPTRTLSCSCCAASCCAPLRTWDRPRARTPAPMGTPGGTEQQQRRRRQRQHFRQRVIHRNRAAAAAAAAAALQATRDPQEQSSGAQEQSSGAQEQSSGAQRRLCCLGRCTVVGMDCLTVAAMAPVCAGGEMDAQRPGELPVPHEQPQAAREKSEKLPASLRQRALWTCKPGSQGRKRHMRCAASCHGIAGAAMGPGRGRPHIICRDRRLLIALYSAIKFFRHTAPKSRLENSPPAPRIKNVVIEINWQTFSTGTSHRLFWGWMACSHMSRAVPPLQTCSRGRQQVLLGIVLTGLL